MGTSPIITQFVVNKAGHLIANYSNTKGTIKAKNFIVNAQGHLIAEGENMAKVDLGNIMGPQGPQGPKGDTGAKGATGATGPKGDKGDKGDTPTFSIENGHLYVDYDNPYTGT